jgi:hypothetical protein
MLKLLQTFTPLSIIVCFSIDHNINEKVKEADLKGYRVTNCDGINEVCPLYKIKSNDNERIVELKEVSASEIYDYKAAHDVNLMTSKRGKSFLILLSKI